MKILFLLSILSCSVLASDVGVDNVSTSLDFAQVKYVKAIQSSNGTWCFNTTVRHNDEGWDHYANGWQVLDLKGNKLAERPLAHPHESEQPFTRSLCNISIPTNLSKVVVSAQCNQHGFGGYSLIVDLNISKASNFSVDSNN